MARPLSYGDESHARQIAHALDLQRQARDLLAAAGASQAVKRARLAITSTTGALRHAETRAAATFERHNATREA